MGVKVNETGGGLVDADWGFVGRYSLYSVGQCSEVLWGVGWLRGGAVEIATRNSADKLNELM